MAALFALGLASPVVGHVVLSAWRWVAYALGGYFLLGAVGMLFYSKVGKLALRERILDNVPGEETKRFWTLAVGADY